MSSSMVLSLIFLLFLQQCTCFTTAENTNLEVNNDQIESTEAAFLKMNQFMESVNKFQQDWVYVQSTIDEVIMNIKRINKQHVTLKTPENEVDHDSMVHSDYYDYDARRSKIVHQKPAGDILASPVENYFGNIMNEIKMFEKEINFLRPLLELQLNSCKDCKKVIQWANIAILSAEEYLSQLIDKQKTGYQLIKKVHKKCSKYYSQRVEIEEQKLKNGLCSNTDDLSKFLCENYDLEDK
ncbi:uncharacterized protein LOC106668201 [Cimex lectularius]|uniref:Uncharacterized protein n=1 Tax=Cimex lectularius TaxID=79782 RepID=A0A8I6RVP5_CIMLE|nr:uncharacterized protein LOC106668201 [Cimex lectularius]